MKRRALSIAVLVMAVIGVGFVAVPFFGSLAPSERAESLVASINVRDMEPGTFTEADYHWWRVFALRDYDGELHVFAVPYRDGQYWLPDPNWDRPFYPCDEFGPDNDQGRLLEDGLFRCQANMYEWITESADFTWTYSGSNQGEFIEHMRAPEFSLSGPHIIVRPKMTDRN